MADTVRTYAALQVLLANNITGDISPQDVRDFLASTYNWVNAVAGGAGAIAFAGGNVGIGVLSLLDRQLCVQSAEDWPVKIIGQRDGTGAVGGVLIGSRSAGKGTIQGYDDSTTVDLLFQTEGGNIGIKIGAGGTPSAALDINSDILRLENAKTPATAGAAGNAGDICWDASNIYVCVATNTWKKIGIATW